MDINQPLFDSPVQVISDQEDCIWVSALDYDVAKKHATTLTSIHDLIPFVQWTPDDLLSDHIGTRVFHHKWKLSILLTRDPGEPVGFLVSYLRPPDSNFDYVSIYMHRMAILAP